MKAHLLTVIYCLFFCFTTAHGKLRLPTQLTQADRRSTLEILGPATSSRMLTSPYPLGGWNGFEIGLSRHYVPISYLSDLGDRSASQGDFEYPLVTLGKGLFYDLDLFLSLVPISQSESINHFSTQLRYQIWRSQNNIFRISGLLHASTTTLNNQLNMQAYGGDFIATSTIDKVSLYFLIGSARSSGRFIGGTQGITNSQQTETETMNFFHQGIGLEWPIGNFFWAAEVDRYKIPYYSLKFGYRI